MRDSQPPPTYAAAWSFQGLIDRWQEIEFRVSHFLIWTGGMDAGSSDLDDPDRSGFHLRGFHGITPETESTSYYFWTISSNRNPARSDMGEKIYRDTALTFDEDRVVIEAQYANMKRFPDAAPIGIHVDAPLNRARRIIERLTAAAMTAQDRLQS
jgi:vanillate O-demethylase monooxygenase subunit